MQAFLRKINPEYSFRQYLPNKSIKPKGTSKPIDKNINGLTGDALISKVYDILNNHKDIGNSSAILIEDDLDARFHDMTAAEIADKSHHIKENIHRILGRDIPVFLLYASPEVEAWFLADWKRSFQLVYCNSEMYAELSSQVKRFFLHHLRLYVFSEVLGRYKDCIEDYGWVDGKYRKLSDELIQTFDQNIISYLQSLANTNDDYIKQIVGSSIRYNKKLHGDIMLRNIEPAVVGQQCKKYFLPQYSLIRDL